MERKAKIISVINYKGGVGKTVSTFNVAAGLAFLNRHKVLLIDLDPQCSLSTICMKAYSHTMDKQQQYSNLKEEETINHVFNSYLNREILDFDFSFDLDKMIKRDFYTGSQMRLEGFDFIPSTMYITSGEGKMRGLEGIESDIKQCFSGDKNGNLKRMSMLAKFIKEVKLDELYDFIIFDCPPSNNYIVQNALFVSDYYVVPSIMDEMGVQGIHHMKAVVEKDLLYKVIKEYETFTRVAPESSYLSFLKSGTPQMLGIIETLRKNSKSKDSSEAEQMRKAVNQAFPNKLFPAIVYHQIEIQKRINSGECCFNKWKSNVALPANKSYGEIVFEILQRLNIPKDKQARSPKDVL